MLPDRRKCPINYINGFEELVTTQKTVVLPGHIMTIVVVTNVVNTETKVIFTATPACDRKNMLLFSRSTFTATGKRLRYMSLFEWAHVHTKNLAPIANFKVITLQPRNVWNDETDLQLEGCLSTGKLFVETAFENTHWKVSWKLSWHLWQAEVRHRFRRLVKMKISTSTQWARLWP